MRCDDPYLTNVLLWRSGLGDGGSAEVAAALERNGAVSTLLLGGNKIGDVGAQSLARVLSCRESSPGLRVLGLRMNDIGDVGAEALAQMLQVNRSIRVLLLGGNRIGDWGVRALSAALLLNETVQVLGLHGNDIGDSGLEALACALRLNRSLSCLEVRRNRSGRKGAEALAAAVRDLGGDFLDQEDLATFADDLFADDPILHLGLEELFAIRKGLDCSPTRNGEELRIFSEDCCCKVKKTSQTLLLRTVYAAGMSRLVQDFKSVRHEAVSLIMERVGSILGVEGVFSIILKNPDLFEKRIACQEKIEYMDFWHPRQIFSYLFRT